MPYDAAENFNDSPSGLELRKYPDLLQEFLKRDSGAPFAAPQRDNASNQTPAPLNDVVPFIPSLQFTPLPGYSLPSKTETPSTAPVEVPKAETPSSELDLVAAFKKEFGDKLARGVSIGDLSLARENSQLADLLYRNFDKLHDLAMTRDGSILAKPKTLKNTISLGDLSHMVDLTERRPISETWSQRSLRWEKESYARNSGWMGALGGALAGGSARVFVPYMKGDGGALCMLMMLGGAAIGGLAGEYFGKRNAETYVTRVTDFDLKSASYADWLGRGYGENTVIAGAGILMAGALLSKNAPKLSLGLMGAGAATIFGGGFIAREFGARSAINELKSERALGDQMINEWEKLKK